jgi:hypothetical protein
MESQEWFGSKDNQVETNYFGKGNTTVSNKSLLPYFQLPILLVGRTRHAPGSLSALALLKKHNTNSFQDYNRATYPAMSTPEDGFHNYTLDWTPSSYVYFSLAGLSLIDTMRGLPTL